MRPPWYVGESRFLRFWPPGMVAFAVVVAVQPGRAGLFYALVFTFCAWLWGRALPWRFAVLDEGIALWFPFGRRMFLPKGEVTVRINFGSSVAYPKPFRRFGYPLTSLQQIPRYERASGLFKVQYGGEAADGIAGSAVEATADFNLNHPGVKAHFAALAVSSMLAQVKHPGFAEEQEWRLIVGLDLLDESKVPDAQRPTLYRSTRMAIVPYIELPLERNWIVSIRVGPGNNVDVREAGVRRLLRTLGCGATVLRSEVPLRS